jgi:anti-sigma regulatory factor (Ser/Thr protein kinase)
VSSSAFGHDHGAAVQHDAFLYDGTAEFLAGALDFIAAAHAADEPVIAALDRSKIALLQRELGRDAAAVQFFDMRELGSNPARLIPAWRQAVDARASDGRPVWGIGEPFWPGRSAAEVAECHRHEALINVAFDDGQALSLLCLYDTGSLDPEVIAAARCTHPAVVAGGTRHASAEYTGLDTPVGSFADPLPDPRTLARTVVFGTGELAEIRRLVARRAHSAGLAPGRREDVVLAVNELATNSIRHGGGSGVLRVWREPEVLICEVSDGGRFEDPLVGRRRPAGTQIGGYGLWLVNQVCDLVQVRSGPGGCTVRVHMRSG